MKPLPLLPLLPLEPQEVLPHLRTTLGWHPATIRAAEALWSRGLPPLGSVDTLPYIFGISPALVQHMRRRPETYYQTFNIPKHNGRRRIDAPRVALKIIQRWIHDHITSPIPAGEECFGFVPGKNIFGNCSKHIGAINMMSIDISDFFPSINHLQVVQVFEGLGFPARVAIQLADLTTWRDGLPQGAPSSPSLSNLVFLPLDHLLSRWAADNATSYSRYADDLTFSSSDRRFVQADVAEIQDLLAKRGFRVNERKTRIVGGGFRHEVTGLSAASRPMPTRSTRRRWRAEFHQARVKGVGDRGHLSGIAGLVTYYDPGLGSKYQKILADFGSH